MDTFKNQWIKSIDNNIIKNHQGIIRRRVAERSFHAGFSLTKQEEEKANEGYTEGSSEKQGLRIETSSRGREFQEGEYFVYLQFLVPETLSSFITTRFTPYPFRCHLLSEAFPDCVYEIAILPPTALPPNAPYPALFFSIFLTVHHFVYIDLFICFNLFSLPPNSHVSMSVLWKFVLLMAKSPIPRTVPYTP